MAEEKKTTVTYDVGPAIDQLEKLDAKLQQSSDAAEDSFKKAGKASVDFEKKLGVLAPKAARLTSDIRTLTTGGFTPLGIALGAAGASIAALVASMVDLPSIFADATEQLDRFNEGLDKQRELAQGSADQRAAFTRETFDDRLDQLKERAADITGEKVAVEQTRESLQDRLAAYRDYYQQINRLANESTRERERLEERLSSLVEKQFLRKNAKLPVSQQITRLVERAASERDSGDFDAAERLLDKAQSLAETSGSRFQVNRLEGEQTKLIRAVEGAANARRAEEAAAKQAQQQTERNIETVNKEIDVLNKRHKALTREQRLNAAESKNVRLERKEFEDLEQANQAARERADIMEKINRLRETERSGIQKGADLLRSVKDVFIGAGGPGLTQQAEQIKEAQRLFEEVNQGLQIGTPEADDAQLENVQKIQEIISNLRATPGLSGAFEFNLDKLERGVQLFRELQESNERFGGAGRGADQQVELDSKSAGELSEGTEQADSNLERSKANATAMAQQLERGADAARKIQALQQLGISINPSRVPGAPTPQTPTPSSPSPGQTSQNITVNANVKGGMIDGDVIRQITDIVRREIRRGTQTA